MSEVENLEKLRGHFVSARRKEVAKVLRSKSPSVVAARGIEIVAWERNSAKTRSTSLLSDGRRPVTHAVRRGK
jgi:hypothetical protein